jgi:rhomboid protease GluP
LPNRKPKVTIALLVITIVLFVVQLLSEMLTGVDLPFLYGGKINEFIKIGQVWRLITPVFLHGSILHLAFNMYALYMLGRRVENFYGHKRFLVLYLLSGFAGNVLSFVFSANPSLGASTAIFGLLAAEGVFLIQNWKLFGPERTRQAIFNLVFILLINLVYGFVPGINIDNFGHIGGLIGGIFFAWKGGPVLNISGQPPFLVLMDVRKKRDVTLAGVIDLLGFTIIAVFPFITG